MKNSTLFFLLFLSSFSLFSQDKSDIKINLGTTFALNSFSSDTQNFDIKYTPQIGFRLGVDYAFYKREKLEIETGLTLSLLRTKIDDPQLGLDIKYTTWYIGSHIIANYEIVPDMLYIGAGPYLDYGISGKQESAGGNSGDLFEGKNGQDAPSKRLNYGAAFKVSYLASFTSFIDDIYFSYRLGLANTEGKDSATQTNTLGSISIGVRANLEDLF